ncbi:ATP-binding cassette domain-containing protein [Bacillus sp. PsM16]
MKDINLTIYEGEKVLIACPSGTGKSTLAQTIKVIDTASYKL